MLFQWRSSVSRNTKAKWPTSGGTALKTAFLCRIFTITQLVWASISRLNAYLIRVSVTPVSLSEFIVLTKKKHLVSEDSSPSTVSCVCVIFRETAWLCKGENEIVSLECVLWGFNLCEEEAGQESGDENTHTDFPWRHYCRDKLCRYSHGRKTSAVYKMTIIYNKMHGSLNQWN